MKYTSADVNYQMQALSPLFAGHHGGHYSVDTGKAVLLKLLCSKFSCTLKGTAGKT